MKGRHPQDEQQEGTYPSSMGVWNIWIITRCRYGHVKICKDKDRKNLPRYKNLIYRIL